MMVIDELVYVGFLILHNHAHRYRPYPRLDSPGAAGLRAGNVRTLWAAAKGECLVGNFCR